jgi:hypothetical protein
MIGSTSSHNTIDTYSREIHSTVDHILVVSGGALNWNGTACLVHYYMDLCRTANNVYPAVYLKL